MATQQMERNHLVFLPLLRREMRSHGAQPTSLTTRPHPRVLLGVDASCKRLKVSLLFRDSSDDVHIVQLLHSSTHCGPFIVTKLKL